MLPLYAMWSGLWSAKWSARWSATLSAAVLIAACGGGDSEGPPAAEPCETTFCGVTIPPEAQDVLDAREPVDATDEVASGLVAELGLAGDDATCVANELAGRGLDLTTEHVSDALEQCEVEIG